MAPLIKGNSRWAISAKASLTDTGTDLDQGLARTGPQKHRLWMIIINNNAHRREGKQRRTTVEDDTLGSEPGRSTFLELLVLPEVRYEVLLAHD